MNQDQSTTVASEPTVTPENGVWYFSGDLLFASRVKSAAEIAGLPFALLGKWPDSPSFIPRWIIVDLATRSGGAAAIATAAKEQYGSAQLLAFGPHVDIAKLKNAREAGFDHVLTRSQFDTLLPTLFRSGLAMRVDADE